MTWTEGFLLDGYPRTPDQAVDSTPCSPNRHRADAAIEITADSDEVTTRLLKRAESKGERTTPKT